MTFPPLSLIYVPKAVLKVQPLSFYMFTYLVRQTIPVLSYIKAILIFDES